MSFEDDEELIFDVESNDDDTEVALIVRSPSGRKITQHKFIMTLEQYLHMVAEAEVFRNETKASLH